MIESWSQRVTFLYDQHRKANLWYFEKNDRRPTAVMQKQQLQRICSGVRIEGEGQGQPKEEMLELRSEREEGCSSFPHQVT